MSSRRRVPRRTRLLLLGVALLVSGCTSSGRPLDSSGPFTERSASTVRVIVQNRNFQDARLYYFRRGVRRTLGVVTGKTDAEFVLNWNLPEPMYIEINLLSGPKCVTPELMVDPGDILELQIDAVFLSTRGCR